MADKGKQKTVNSKKEKNSTGQAKTKKKSSKKWLRRGIIFLKGLFYFLVLCTIIGGSIGVYLLLSAIKDVGHVDVSNLKKSLSVESVVYDTNNKVLGSFKSSETRIVSDFEDIPQDIKNAVLAIEDTDFYSHGGVNVKRILGALVHNLKVGYTAQGGSTLTQQLAKNLFLSNERTLDRKLKEVAYSMILEKELTKDEIFELYLNSIYLGKSSYSVASAAKNYFDKELDELTLAESALLAGITKFPTKYDAYKAYEISLEDDFDNLELVFYDLGRDVTKNDKKIYKKLLKKKKISKALYTQLVNGQKTVYKAVFNEASKERQEVVLKRMLDVGFITKEEYDNAVAEKIVINIPDQQDSVISSYFNDYVKDDVIKSLMEQGYTKDESTKMLLEGGLQIHTTLDYEVQSKVEDHFEDESNFPHTKENSNGIPQPQGAMVVIDHSTGSIRAMVGGRGVVGNGLYNRAINPRQPGSTIKPLAAYIPALMNKDVYPSTKVKDSPMTYKGKTWPNNYMKKYRGDITVEEAVMHSSNVVAVKTLLSLSDTNSKSIKKSIGFMKDLGITTIVDKETSPSHHDENPSLVLGGMTKGISPLEMAGAYSAIANKGVYIKPRAVVKVVDNYGEVIYENNVEKKRVFSEQVAYDMTSMLTSVVTAGTGTPARSNYGIQTAGKTGTTSDNKDGWFVGYTPSYTASIWLGADSPYEIPQISRYAVKMWGRIFNDIQDSNSKKTLYSKGSLKDIDICSDTGEIANKKCEKLNKDISVSLLKSEIPTKECTKHEYTEYDKWEDEQKALAEQQAQDEAEREANESESNSSSESSSESNSGLSSIN